MILIFVAVAVLGTLLYDLQQVIDYRMCLNQPVTDLSQHCKEMINGNF